MFLFSEDDYRVDESARTVPVLVTKNTQIATQVELMVIPLTVQNASLPLPPNTPADDSHSPPFAGSLRIIISCNINMDIIAIIVTLTTLKSKCSLSLMRMQKPMKRVFLFSLLMMLSMKHNSKCLL